MVGSQAGRGNPGGDSGGLGPSSHSLYVAASVPDTTDLPGICGSNDSRGGVPLARAPQSRPT